MTDTQGNNLEVLASHRYEISLAEVAAWLHNYDKCSDKHLRGTTLRDNTQNPPPESIVDPIQYLPLLATYTIRLLGEEITLIDLIKEFSSSPDLMTDMSKEWLIRALGFCHSVAHTEKADRSFYSRMQEFADLRSSSPFGHDSSPPITSTLSLTNQLKSLLEQLKSLLPDLPSSRSTCRQCIELMIQLSLPYSYVGDS